MGEAVGAPSAPELDANNAPNHSELTSNTQGSSSLGELACASLDKQITQVEIEEAKLDPLDVNIINIVWSSDIPLSSGRVYERLEQTTKQLFTRHGDVSGMAIRMRLQNLDSLNFVKRIGDDLEIYVHPDYEYQDYLDLLDS